MSAEAAFLRDAGGELGPGWGCPSIPRAFRLAPGARQSLGGCWRLCEVICEEEFPALAGDKV